MPLSKQEVTDLVQAAEQLAESALSGKVKAAVVVILDDDELSWRLRANLDSGDALRLIGALDVVKSEVGAIYRRGNG